MVFIAQGHGNPHFVHRIGVGIRLQVSQNAERGHPFGLGAVVGAEPGHRFETQAGLHTGRLHGPGGALSAANAAERAHVVAVLAGPAQSQAKGDVGQGQGYAGEKKP